MRADRADQAQFIIDCDNTWCGESTGTNENDEYMLQFLMSHNLDIINVCNKPTFVNTRHIEVIDVI